MSTVNQIAAIGIAALAISGAQAVAQSLGEVEYMNSCAACHGADGKGEGPITRFLVDVPPDLTVLSKDNGGVFPVSEVYAAIDGTADVAVHGGRDMPIWGDRYSAEVQQGTVPYFTAEEAQRYARNRILALTEYLASIQVE